MSRYYVPLKGSYYIPLKGLPEYCCECPCSSEGSTYDLDTGTEVSVDITCRITGNITASCAPTALYPDWNAVPRPDNCPIKIIPIEV